MRQRILFIHAALGIACVLPPGSGAAPLPAPAGDVDSLAALPAEIRAHIGPDVSDRGGPFAAGCGSVHGEPHSRFSKASIDGDVAQVTIERGGIAHFFDTLEYRRVDGHWVHVASSGIKRAPPAPPPRTPSV